MWQNELLKATFTFEQKICKKKIRQGSIKT